MSHARPFRGVRLASSVRSVSLFVALRLLGLSCLCLGHLLWLGHQVSHLQTLRRFQCLYDAPGVLSIFSQFVSTPRFCTQRFRLQNIEHLILRLP